MTGKKTKNVICTSEIFYYLHTKSSPPLPTIYLLSKTWSGQIMKLAVTGNQSNQRISYKMRSQWNQSIISKGW